MILKKIVFRKASLGNEKKIKNMSKTKESQKHREAKKFVSAMLYGAFLVRTFCY